MAHGLAPRPTMAGIWVSSRTCRSHARTHAARSGTSPSYDPSSAWKMPLFASPLSRPVPPRPAPSRPASEHRKTAVAEGVGHQVGFASLERAAETGARAHPEQGDLSWHPQAGLQLAKNMFTSTAYSRTFDIMPRGAEVNHLKSERKQGVTFRNAERSAMLLGARQKPSSQLKAGETLHER